MGQRLFGFRFPRRLISAAATTAPIIPDISFKSMSENNPADLFDEFGRCIPAESVGAHRKSRRYFQIAKPEIDYAAILERSVRHFGNSIADELDAARFQARVESILEGLSKDLATKNITRGVGIPFIVPKTTEADIGAALEKTYLPAVAAAFHEKLPDATFKNHNRHPLDGQLGIVSGSRHESLIEAAGRSAVVGIYFPCLSEYSVPGAVAQTKLLPEQFTLAGGYDTCAALVGTPDLLIRADGYPPLLWLGALETQDKTSGFHFEAYGLNLTFNHRGHHDKMAEYWWCGLSVLG
ncbi:MAG TPA: hypothetical protein VJ673_13460 [Aromatoleum sp.]|uniref:hypothetical protein n=1 Tax=Aromatoleum sp. TaxID=2307007 RepID=UPI002B48D292|nr:hypothetical protein [Aromatoleum sp.]HJV26690.1 hypothetical protein [Aromatoleum sp.]